MVLSYASNIQKIIDLFFKSAICQLVGLCLFTIVPYMMVIIGRNAVLGSLLSSPITLSSLRSCQSSVISQLLQNSAEKGKFHGKGQIPWLSSKFRGPLKTVGPSDEINNATTWLSHHQSVSRCYQISPHRSEKHCSTAFHTNGNI